MIFTIPELKLVRYSEGKLGRIFILRLNDGERLPQTLESFAREKRIDHGLCFILGGVKSGGKVVVGPSSAGLPPDHVVAELKGVHEICGMGTLILDEKGDPKLHMHAAFGRGGTATVGCIRLGVEVWQVGEVVVLEIEGSSAKRRKDKKTGFNLLETQ